MYDYMTKNMLLVNIIFRDMVIRHSPVNKTQSYERSVPYHGETTWPILVSRTVKQPVDTLEAPAAVITLGLPIDHREYVALPQLQSARRDHPLLLHSASLHPDLLRLRQQIQPCCH